MTGGADKEFWTNAKPADVGSTSAEKSTSQGISITRPCTELSCTSALLVNKAFLKLSYPSPRKAH